MMRRRLWFWCLAVAVVAVLIVGVPALVIAVGRGGAAPGVIAAAIISSSRIDSAVSGGRSWGEASDASSRSAASRLLSRRADVSSPTATWSRSATPYLRPSGRGSPAARRPAASASSSTGRPSRLASMAASQPASPTATAIAAAITPGAAPP